MLSAAELNPSKIICCTDAAISEFWKHNYKDHIAPSIDTAIYPKWKPPDHNSIKINYDGAFSSKSVRAGIGLICRDHKGCFLKGCFEQVTADCSSLAELKARDKAVSVVRDFTPKPVIIEMDRKELFTIPQSKQAALGPWKYHNVLQSMLVSKKKVYGIYTMAITYKQLQNTQHETNKIFHKSKSPSLQ